jgi:hypothetical protein
MMKLLTTSAGISNMCIQQYTGWLLGKPAIGPDIISAQI